jgi:hypothetical protein
MDLLKLKAAIVVGAQSTSPIMLNLQSGLDPAVDFPVTNRELALL